MIFKRKHRHKFEDMVLFEAIRQFQMTDEIHQERYVAAVGQICKCGQRVVKYINVFGYYAKPDEMNKIAATVRLQTTDWLAGEDSKRLLYMRKIKIPKKVKYSIDTSQ